MTCQCGPLVAGKTRQLNRNNKVPPGLDLLPITLSHPELHTDVIHDLEGFSPPRIEILNVTSYHVLDRVGPVQTQAGNL